MDFIIQLFLAESCISSLVFHTLDPKEIHLIDLKVISPQNDNNLVHLQCTLKHKDNVLISLNIAPMYEFCGFFDSFEDKVTDAVVPLSRHCGPQISLNLGIDSMNSMLQNF